MTLLSRQDMINNYISSLSGLVEFNRYDLSMIKKFNLHNLSTPILIKDIFKETFPKLFKFLIEEDPSLDKQSVMAPYKFFDKDKELISYFFKSYKVNDLFTYMHEDSLSTTSHIFRIKDFRSDIGSVNLILNTPYGERVLATNVNYLIRYFKEYGI